MLPEAEDEIISAALWYDDQRLGLGDEFVAELHAELNLVKTHAASLPTLEGYAGQHDVRRHLMKRFPYAIVVARIRRRLCGHRDCSYSTPSTLLA